MNIKKLSKRKNNLEMKLDDINYEVKKRWYDLTSDKYIMNHWSIYEIDNSMVSIGYVHEYSILLDLIPIKFFEIKDAEQARKEYKIYTAEKMQQQILDDEKELELYKKLHEKHGDPDPKT